MAQEERNIKITVDDSAFRKLSRAIDETAEKLLRQSSNITSRYGAAGDHEEKPVEVKNIPEDDKFYELLKQMKENFSSMLSSTEKMLQNMGLMNSELGRTVRTLLSMIDAGFKIFDIGKSIFGFVSSFLLPANGAGAAGGLMESLTPAPLPALVNSSLSSPNITVIVNSEVERSKAVKFLQNYVPKYNSRNSTSTV